MGTIALVILAAGAVGWLIKQNRKILMTQRELSAALDNLTAQVGKVALEQSNRFDTLSAEIQRLKDVIEAGEVQPEVATALANVQTALQSLDDAIPDAPTPPSE